MKSVSKLIALSFIILTSCVPSKVAQANSSKQLYINHGIEADNQAVNANAQLEIALHESVIIRRDEESYSGQLVDMTPLDITITANGEALSVDLSEVDALEFRGDIWIETDGKRVWLDVIRSYPVTIENVPASEFEMIEASHIAHLNLTDVLNRSELERLLAIESDEMYALEKIVFLSPDLMNITIEKVALSSL